VINNAWQRFCVTYAARANESLDRRHFLGTTVRTSMVAVAALVWPAGAPEAQAYDPGAKEGGARYHESDHVNAFYRTNGYETLKK
jgi:hypothetical protein